MRKRIAGTTTSPTVSVYVAPIAGEPAANAAMTARPPIAAAHDLNFKSPRRNLMSITSTSEKKPTLIVTSTRRTTVPPYHAVNSRIGQSE